MSRHNARNDRGASRRQRSNDRNITHPRFNDSPRMYNQPLTIDCGPQGTRSYIDEEQNRGANLILIENGVEEFSSSLWQDFRNENVVVWLKAYILDSDEGNSFLNGLKFLASQKKWTVFRNVITQKWISLGYDVHHTDCLETKRACVAAWAELNLVTTMKSNINQESYLSTANLDQRDRRPSSKDYHPPSSHNFSDDIYDDDLQITIKNNSNSDTRSRFDRSRGSDNYSNRLSIPKENYTDANSRQRLNEYDIVLWLKSFISDGKEGHNFFNGLKFLASEKKWPVFRSVIKQKWSSLGFDERQADCLEETHMCVAIWTELNDTQMQREQNSKNADSKNYRNYDRQPKSDVGRRDWYHGTTKETNERGSSRSSRNDAGAREGHSRNKKDQSNLLAWLQSYISQDPNGKQMLSELDDLANKGNWRDFASLISADWLSLGRSKDDILCLDDWRCCEDIWRNYCQSKSFDIEKNARNYDAPSHSSRSQQRSYGKDRYPKLDSYDKRETNHENRRKKAADYGLLEYNHLRNDSYNTLGISDHQDRQKRLENYEMGDSGRNDSGSYFNTDSKQRRPAGYGILGNDPHYSGYDKSAISSMENRDVRADNYDTIKEKLYDAGSYHDSRISIPDNNQRRPAGYGILGNDPHDSGYNNSAISNMKNRDVRSDNYDTVNDKNQDGGSYYDSGISVTDSRQKKGLDDDLLEKEYEKFDSFLTSEISNPQSRENRAANYNTDVRDSNAHDSYYNAGINNPVNTRKRAANYDILEHDWRVDSFAYNKTKR